jgi:drug/metabolite transporter (DMT)-like permease
VGSAGAAGRCCWPACADCAATLLAATPAARWPALAIGLLGTTGPPAADLALGQAPASTLMPFMYLQIGLAALGGWLVFGDVPDGWGWIGMAVIAVCGAASAWLNVREAAPARCPWRRWRTDLCVD